MKNGWERITPYWLASLGVAVHHGALPTPFRKEIERLLRDNVLRVTVSSPTLGTGAQSFGYGGCASWNSAQPGAKKRVRVPKRRRARGTCLRGRRRFGAFSLLSGRCQAPRPVGDANCRRRAARHGKRRPPPCRYAPAEDAEADGHEPSSAAEYVLNNAAAWNFPVLPAETPEISIAQERQWHQYLATLDTAILSLVGEQDVAQDQVAAKLDDILSSSLWERRLRHRTEERQALFKSLLHGRANSDGKILRLSSGVPTSLPAWAT